MYKYTSDDGNLNARSNNYMTHASRSPLSDLSPILAAPTELPPISRLPPEILEDVFVLCISWFYTSRKLKNPLAWMRVCRAWHNIGLNAGRLWQHINLDDLFCATEFLARSRQAPLYITATSPISSIPSDLALHASRLRSINVTLFQKDMVQLFVSIGPNLPMLANLSLKFSPITSSLLLDLSLPSLRRLSLDGVLIRWKEYRNLTYLCVLFGHPDNPAFFPSLSQILGLFHGSPDLEYIRLEGFVPSPSEAAQFPPVTLRHLKDFIILSSPSVVRSILSAVNLGVETRLQLHVAPFERLCSIFPSGRLQASGPKDVNNVRMSRYSICFIQRNAPAWCDDPAMFRISLRSASVITLHVCRSLSHVIEPTSITRLEFNIGVLLDIPLQALKSLFRDLQRLQSLCTAFNELVELLVILESIDEATRLVYLPQLVRLSFGKPTDMWWDFGDKWAELIFKILEYRRKNSFILQILELCNCQGLTPAMIEALETVVDEVVVIEQADSDIY